MIFSDYLNVIFYITTLAILTPFIGRYIAAIYEKDEDGPVESFLYRLLSIPIKNQSAGEYLIDIIQFSVIGFIVFFIIIIFPQEAKSPMSLDLAINTAISFMTNTNWQSYAGEVSLSPISQMLAMTVQNFVSAGTGIAVFIAFTRGLRNKNIKEIGNFYRDLTRSILYFLLPMSIVLSILLAGTGVIQTLFFETNITSLEGVSQVLHLGPVASQVAIKQLGTNGGGFFGMNSAHPFENPTPFSNYLQMVAILLIPCSLVFTFGAMLKRPKHALVIFSVMSFLWITGLGLSLYSEHKTNKVVDELSFMEGKEVRFSKSESVLWATATTAASNGSVNSMHSSLSPLSSLVALLNILSGEIIFGGVGSGMYGMIIFIILTVFLSGLMVGRTPEYLQKKIDSYDIKLVIIALILPSCTILIGTALSIWSDFGLASRSHSGAHGLSEILYAWASTGGNNGSAFAGLNTNTLFYNILLSVSMLIGRFGVIIPSILLAGSFSNKKIMAKNPGQMSTESKTFAALLLGVIVVIGALTFFPALLLGPIIEHLLML